VCVCVCVCVCVLLTGDDNAELGDQSFQYINVKALKDDSLVRGAVILDLLYFSYFLNFNIFRTL